MTLYIAHNTAVDATTAFTGGQAFTSTNAQMAIQLNVPDNQVIRIAEFGWSQDVATATSTLLALQTTDTSTAGTTAFTTTSIKPLVDRDARASSLTMATSSYGTTTITSRTVLRNIEQLYVPQVYVKQWPLGQWPIVGSGTGENFVQLNAKVTANTNVLCWIVWDEA